MQKSESLTDQNTSNMKRPLPERISILVELLNTVHRLRAPGGCPWDQAQTHQSLRQYLIEEAYEVLDVIDQIHTSEDLKNQTISAQFKEELGDVLLQVVLHAEMTQEVKQFDFFDVAKTLNDKLIRRHPHVFLEAKADSVNSALQNWEKEKAKEKLSNPDASILDSLPRNLPALQRTARMIEKVSKVGFQWADLRGPLDKLDEELGELKAEVIRLEQVLKDESNRSISSTSASTSASSASASSSTAPSSTSSPDRSIQDQREKVESELGDLLFSLCNVAHFLNVNPESALRSTLGRFETRFKHVEKGLKSQGKTPEQSSLPEMDKLWNEAKKIEKSRLQKKST